MIWHDTIFVSFYSFFTTRFSITASEITIALPKYKYLPFGSGLVDMCNDRCRECRNGYRFFEIITPYTDGHINGSYYQELNGADAQNVIYQATASAPLDVAPPVAMCRNVTVHLNNTGNGNTTVALVNNGSTDICGIQSISLNLTNFTCANIGANTVTLTVTDISNNSSTCTATVMVTDGVLPIAVCQNVTVNLDHSGNGVITESGANNGSSDACGIQSFVLDQTTFTCADMTANPHTVTLTVTDVNGNVNTCGAIVTILDPVGPTPVCPEIADMRQHHGNRIHQRRSDTSQS